MQLKCAGCPRTRLLLAPTEICSVGGQSDVKDVESYPASPPPPLAATVSPVCQFKFKWPAETGMAANVYIRGRTQHGERRRAAARGLAGGRRGVTGAVTSGVVFIKCFQIRRDRKRSTVVPDSSGRCHVLCFV